MRIEPVEDRLIVLPDKAAEKTAGGIALPDVAQLVPAEGEVVAVGPGRTLDNGTLLAPRVRVGMRVVWEKTRGVELRDEDVVYRCLREGELLGIVRK